MRYESDSGDVDHPGYGNLERNLGDGGGRRHRWLLIAVFALLLFLIGGSFAAYAYDDSRRDQVANGITVGGVDIGGLDEEEAERYLRAQLLDPVRKPIKVTHAGRTWKLPAKQLRVRADVEAMVDRALAESRDGGLPGRLVRYVTGGSVDERITPTIEYSQPAVNRFVRRIARDIDRAAQDAAVSPTGSSLNVVPARSGRELRDNLLEKRLAGVVTSANRPRRIQAVVRTTRPEITTSEVAQRYPTYITVDQASFTVRVWKDLKLAREYTVAVGQPAYPTPYGLYSIANKQVDPVWSVPNSDWAGELAGTVVAGGTAANPLKARWMGVTDGVGFHGTDITSSLGTQASHGCIRMAVGDIVEMYDLVPVGTPVYIG
jgi:lipoprotein-anchoring transpeptidase ErfK/SrfK